MIEEQGIVVDIKADKAVIKTERGSTCEKCQAKDLCQSIGGGNEMLVEALNPVNAKKGDRVIFKVAAAAILKTSLILYLAPLFGFISGVVIGQEVAGYISPDLNPDLASGIFGIIFLVIAFFSIRLYGKSAENKEGFRPIIVRIINAR